MASKTFNEKAEGVVVEMTASAQPSETKSAN
jgi:hypothetical protein